MAAVFLASSFVQLGTKVLKVDNRLLLALAFIMSIIGSILIGDWQAIGHDPCLSVSSYQHLNISINSSELTDTDNGQSGAYPTALEQHHSGFDAMYYSGDLPLSQLSLSDEMIITSNLSQSLSERCEALSSSSHKCFWNPHSRITGEYCNTCHASCHSEQKSSNFFQFSTGVLLVSLASGLGFVFVSAIASAYAPLETQGTVFTFVLGSGTLSRTVSPLWLVETYELFGKHTYLPMAISSGCLVVLLFMLAALYKELAPRSTPSEGNVVYFVPATFDTKEHEVTEAFMKYVYSSMEQSMYSASTFVPNNKNVLVSEGKIKDFTETVHPLHQQGVNSAAGDINYAAWKLDV